MVFAIIESTVSEVACTAMGCLRFISLMMVMVALLPQVHWPNQLLLKPYSCAQTLSSSQRSFRGSCFGRSTTHPNVPKSASAVFSSFCRRRSSTSKIFGTAPTPGVLSATGWRLYWQSPSMKANKVRPGRMGEVCGSRWALTNVQRR